MQPNPDALRRRDLMRQAACVAGAWAASGTLPVVVAGEVQRHPRSLLVDVHGSTPFHASMTMLDGTRAAEVLCGVNLPMLIKLANFDRSNGPPIVLAEELRDSGRRSIRLGSELTGKVAVEERR